MATILKSKVGEFFIDSTKTPGQIQTISGVGFQPKLLYLFWAGTTSASNVATSGTVRYGWGFVTSDETTQCLSVLSMDAVGTSDVYGQIPGTAQNISMLFINTTTPTYAGIYSFDAFNSDGFSFQVSGQATQDWRVSYLALGGATLENKLTIVTGPAALGNWVATGIPFTPEVCTFHGMTGGARSNMNIGWATASDEQADVMGMSWDALATTDTAHLSTTADVQGLMQTSTTEGYRHVFVNFHPSGATLNHTTTSTARGVNMVGMRGARFKVGNFLSRTTSGYITVSGLGFKPEAILFASAGYPESVALTPTPHMKLSLGAASATSGQIAIGMWDEDALGDAETAYGHYTNAVYLNIQDDALQGYIRVHSWDDYGFTLYQPDADSTNNFITYLAFGEEFVPSKSAYLRGSGYLIIPDSDIASSGNWINQSEDVTLYPSINDFDNDATYVWYDNAYLNSFFEVGLAKPPTTPSGVHILSWKGYKKGGTKSTTIQCDLKQSSNIVVTDTRVLSNTTVKQFDRQLTSGEIGKISGDYDNLSVRFTVIDFT